MNIDKLVQRSTATAVVFLAVIAGWVSYIHAHDVVVQYGQTGMLGYAYPITTDGLIYVASMVILNAARKAIKAPKLAWFTLITGILVTGTANVYDGLHHGVIGAIISGWPAVALVLGYELCMMLIRSAGKAEADPVALGLMTINERRAQAGYPSLPENLATSQEFRGSVNPYDLAADIDAANAVGAGHEYAPMPNLVPRARVEQTNDNELPGMWEAADFTGGQTDAEHEEHFTPEAVDQAVKLAESIQPQPVSPIPADVQTAPVRFGGGARFGGLGDMVGGAASNGDRKS